MTRHRVLLVGASQVHPPSVGAIRKGSHGLAASDHAKDRPSQAARDRLGIDLSSHVLCAFRLRDDCADILSRN